MFETTKGFWDLPQGRTSSAIAADALFTNTRRHELLELPQSLQSVHLQPTACSTKTNDKIICEVLTVVAMGQGRRQARKKAGGETRHERAREDGRLDKPGCPRSSGVGCCPQQVAITPRPCVNDEMRTIQYVSVPRQCEWKICNSVGTYKKTTFA
jgi:hypothetical protein